MDHSPEDATGVAGEHGLMGLPALGVRCLMPDFRVMIRELFLAGQEEAVEFDLGPGIDEVDADVVSDEVTGQAQVM